MIRFNFPTNSIKTGKGGCSSKAQKPTLRVKKKETGVCTDGTVVKKKNLPVQETQEAWVPPLCWEDPLE